MKRFAAVLAVLALAAFAVPALANGVDTAPFADVPQSHWSYDALQQLTARGLISGQNDGLFSGETPATRYEMASVLAKSLAYVDINKASKQDIELLKKLVIEFKNELSALGVQNKDLDGRVAVLEEGLAGWRFGGQLRFDARFGGENPGPYAFSGDTDFEGTRYWLWVSKKVDDKVDVTFRLGNADEEFSAITKRFYGNLDNNVVALQRAYATVKLPADWLLTVGKQDAPDFEADAGFKHGSSFFGFSDLAVNGFRIDRSFSQGSFTAFVSHMDLLGSGIPEILEMDGIDAYYYGARLGWTPNEKFGFGANYLALAFNTENSPLDIDTYWFDAMFAITYDVALRGAYYVQDSPLLPSANAWKAAVEIDQRALGFTGLWVEYASLDKSFIADPWAYSFDNHTIASVFGWTEIASIFNPAADGIDVWNIRADQKWSDKWGTFARYVTADSGPVDGKNWTFGVQHFYTPKLSFELAYDTVDLNPGGDDHMIRFRTNISF